MKDNTSHRKEGGGLPRARTTIQWSALAITLLVGLRHIMPGEAARGGSFDSFCPVGGIETLLPYALTGNTLRSTTLLNFSILLAVLGLGLVAGRAFCGWMCPLGTLQEYLARMARRLSGDKSRIRGKANQAALPIRLPPSLDRALRYAKYPLLALILVASLFTLWPPLFELCPARSIFSFKQTTLLLAVLALFVVGSLLVERMWCKYLCPLAAVLAPMNKIAPLRLVINQDRCTHCGRCEVDCLMGIEAVPENLDHPECVRCLECYETCAQDGALVLALTFQEGATPE